MTDDLDRMARELLIEGVPLPEQGAEEFVAGALGYVYARLAVEAGKAAAALLDAATAHAKNHGNGDSWTLAAVEASEALSDIVVSLCSARGQIETKDEP